MIIDTINSDLKKAMLAGDKPLVEVLKGIKTAVQYLSVSMGVDNSPSEDEIVNTLKKEQKKRIDAADLYKAANEVARADKELYESEMIAKYLPATLSESEVATVVDQEIEKIGGLDSKNMGQVIGAVKKVCGPASDGSVIARIVKERL